MYKVTAYFKDKKVVKVFVDLYDAIDFRDVVDAHYPIKVTFEKVIDMREWIYDCWNSVMNMDRNPLRHIPDLQVRHMVLQILAWMWCIVFSFLVGSFNKSIVGKVNFILLIFIFLLFFIKGRSS